MLQVLLPATALFQHQRQLQVLNTMRLSTAGGAAILDAEFRRKLCKHTAHKL